MYFITMLAVLMFNAIGKFCLCAVLVVQSISLIVLSFLLLICQCIVFCGK